LFWHKDITKDVVLETFRDYICWCLGPEPRNLGLGLISDSGVHNYMYLVIITLHYVTIFKVDCYKQAMQ